MPNRDKTGPRGLGPRTGRGLGGCKSYDSKKTKTTGRKTSKK